MYEPQLPIARWRTPSRTFFSNRTHSVQAPTLVAQQHKVENKIPLPDDPSRNKPIDACAPLQDFTSPERNSFVFHLHCSESSGSFISYLLLLFREEDLLLSELVDGAACKRKHKV
ncbi:hypothetical protein CDAR_190111 [Caerostris darwini]|uniref:Uncharacterized protein n=1 Tax=Caerostris darwini TaxID=1538125 RepID=A0AAV4WUA8_9ARAC|nr:hypothetical protein CDAR_190111 [Caerostris darwini]